MDTKDELVSHIKSWLQYDSDISNLQKQIKELRENKKNLTSSLVDVMKNNEIDCFDITNGKLIYSKSKIKKPINKKSLLEALQVYFKDNTELAQNVSQHILDNREETVKESIRHKKIN